MNPSMNSNHSVAAGVSALNGGAKRALAQKEAKARKVQVAKVRRSIVFLAAIIMPLCLMFLLIVDYMYRPSAFAIESIQQEGEFKRVDATEVANVARHSLSGNFFTANLELIRVSIESLPWVRRVAVRREWPSTIVLRVFEHKPVMRWNSEAWVSYRGEKIKASKQERVSEQFTNRVRLSGDANRVLEVMNHANQWTSALESQNLQLLGVSKTESGAWSLSLKDRRAEHEVKVMLGSEQYIERFERFLRMYEQNDNLVRVSKLIDVRYPNGMAIVPFHEMRAKKAGAS